MSGTLAHARRFRRSEPYIGRDGNLHYEVVVEDGDQISLSNSTWNEVKRLAVSIGVPEDAWPQYGSSIDLDMADLESRNKRIRNLLAGVDETAVVGHDRLHQLWKWACEGVSFYFAET